MCKADNGLLIGMTRYGGANNKGVVLSYNVNTDSLVILHSFNGVNGEEPHGSVIQVDNNLYGLTARGGINNDGVLFKYDMLLNEYTKLYDFDNEGKYPYGDLTMSDTGVLYGLTRYGGVYGKGVLFEYNINDSLYTAKFNFNSNDNNGYNPSGGLLYSSNGKLYCMTAAGGDYYSNGTLVEYDPILDTLIKKVQFDGINGSESQSNNLIEVCYNSFNNISETACDTYIVPSGNQTYTSSGIYTDTLSNICGSDSIITIDLTINTVNVNVNQNSAILSAETINADYQWLDCDNNFAEIIGADGQTYSPQFNGNYAVQVIENSCIDTSTCYYVTTVSVSNKAFGDLLNVYPNPTNGKLFINLGNNFNKCTLKVENIDGRFVSQKEYYNSDIIEFEIEGGKGFYLINIITDKGDRALFKVLKM